MKLTSYLEETNQTITSFAKEHGLPVTTVWRTVRKVGSRNETTLKKIVSATQGAVSFNDLVSE